jgi:hypothetical protein
MGGPQGTRGPRGLKGADASGEGTASWITAIAALLAVIGGAATLFDNRRTARRRVTFESVERLEETSLIEQQAVMSSFLRGGLQPPNISDADWATMDQAARLAAAPSMWEHLSESSSLDDRKTKLQILAYPNRLEGIAAMYNGGLLEPKIVKTQVEAEAQNFWDVAEWWLTEVRAADNKTFKEIEVMLERLAKQKRPKPYR